jgi:hypothetical protein
MSNILANFLNLRYQVATIATVASVIGKWLPSVNGRLKYYRNNREHQ